MAIPRTYTSWVLPVLLVIAAGAALSQIQPALAKLISPQSETLQLSTTFKPDFRGTLAYISADGNSAYFYDSNQKSQTAELRVVSIPEFSTVATIALAHTALSVQVDLSDPDRVFVAGELDGQQVVTVVALRQSTQQSFVSSLGKGIPSVLPDRSGGAYVANSDTKTIKRLPSSSFQALDVALDNFKAKPSEPETWQIAGVAGVIEMALSPDGSAIFVSDSGRPQIVAISTEMAGAVLARFGNQSAEIGELTPLQFSASTKKTQRTKSGEAASLIIADSNQNRLILTDFNESVSTFDFIADASLGLGQQQQRRRSALDAVHLGVSADQSVIVLGNSESATLDLLSRSGATLQRLLPIDLSGQPVAVSISGDGKRGLAQTNNGSVAFLTSDNFATQFPTGDEPKFYGDELTRKVQYRLDRMGFQVGVIDGIPGSRTRIAASDAITKFGLDPTLSIDDPEALLQALDSLKSAN